MHASREDGASRHAQSDLVAALAACRLVLDREFTSLPADSPYHAALAAVRPNLVVIASVSRQNDVPPERMIVMLKRMIREVPCLLEWRETRRDTLSYELVELTIKAYYDGAGSGGHGAP